MYKLYKLTGPCSVAQANDGCPAVTNSRLRVQGNIDRKPQPIWAVKTTVLAKIVRRKSIHE